MLPSKISRFYQLASDASLLNFNMTSGNHAQDLEYNTEQQSNEQNHHEVINHRNGFSLAS